MEEMKAPVAAGSEPVKEAEALVPTAPVSDETALLQEICAKLETQNAGTKKQLALTRVCLIAVAVIALLAIVCAVVVVPPMYRTIEGINQSVSALDMQVISETIAEIQKVAVQSNTVVAEAGTAIEQINALDFVSLNKAIGELETAVQNFAKLDVDSLNKAIKDLGDTIEPMATIVNNMKNIFG